MKSLKELMNLQGRVALITGGAGHIGSAIGDALAELGAAIAVLDMGDCEAAANRLRDHYGVDTLPVQVDLNDEATVRTTPEIVVRQLGRLDILVNCAGFGRAAKLEGWVTPFEQQSADTWRKALEINLTASFVLTQACTEALRASGCGSVINVSSIYGMVGPDMRLYEGSDRGNPAAYAASKGGLLQMTRWLATVLAPDIRVNAITPGGVWRSQPQEFLDGYNARTPMGRMATEEDLKGAAAYLASDLSAYVTGHNLVVDGGWTVW